MRCFYHPQSDAVGICKSCNKGVCQECALDVGNGIACKNRCENEVKAVNEIIGRGKTAYQKTAAAYARYAIVSLLIALVFLVFGLSELNTAIAYFMIPAGVIFLLNAGFSYYTGKKFIKK